MRQGIFGAALVLALAGGRDAHAAMPRQEAVGGVGLIEVVRSRSGGGSHSVRGHMRRDGTYVPGHRATNPDSSRRNNWSTRGNVNPYTGRPGTVDPYRR